MTLARSSALWNATTPARRLLLLCVGALALHACADAPQPYCMPPEVSRGPDTSSIAPVPRTNPNVMRDQDEYALCKKKEAYDRDEAKKHPPENTEAEPD